MPPPYFTPHLAFLLASCFGNLVSLCVYNFATRLAFLRFRLCILTTTPTLYPPIPGLNIRLVACRALRLNPLNLKL